MATGLYQRARVVYFLRMNTEKFRKRFLSRIGDAGPFRQLLDLLPDVAFFMKDRRSRFVMQNRRSCEFCRVASEAQTIGKTDYDFYPRDRAELYVRGDRQVISTGVPIINAIAPAPEEEGSDRLIIYSKVPVRDAGGRIIGVAGIHRRVDGVRAAPHAYGRLSRAIEMMHRHSARRLSTRRLAEAAGVSHSQFDRRFRKLFGTTPREYLLRVRVNAACRLLEETDRTVTDIAQEVGFYDHSHFSRTFRRIMGVAPQRFRRMHEGR